MSEKAKDMCRTFSHKKNTTRSRVDSAREARTRNWDIGSDPVPKVGAVECPRVHGRGVSVTGRHITRRRSLS